MPVAWRHGVSYTVPLRFIVSSRHFRQQHSCSNHSFVTLTTVAIHADPRIYVELCRVLQRNGTYCHIRSVRVEMYITHPGHEQHFKPRTIITVAHHIPDLKTSPPCLLPEPLSASASYTKERKCSTSPVSTSSATSPPKPST
jgi:hypothetical protein